MSDHARGCEGRNYSCTCGYDDAVTARIEALEAEVERLLRNSVGRRHVRITYMEAVHHA